MSLKLMINQYSKNQQFKNLINQSNQNKFEQYQETILKDLNFNENDSTLSFKIIQQTYKPKILKYVQRNNQKYPIYSDQPSISTKNLYEFKRVVNVKLFCRNQIHNIKYLDEGMKIEICHKLNFIPEWLEIKNAIKDLQSQNNVLRNELNSIKHIFYQFDTTNLQEEPTKLSRYIFTFGFLYKNYVSKKQAEINKQTNQANKIANEKHKIDIDNLNLESEKHKEEIKLKIEENNLKIQDLEIILENSSFNNQKKSNNEWINLKEAFGYNQNHLKDKKGIYIIRNQTKNKYYVGQSKDLYKRIFVDHFSIKDCDVNNKKFFKDWYEGDQFFIRYIFCDTKDELDHLEKQYIEEYDSFENGYNKTSGNK